MEIRHAQQSACDGDLNQPRLYGNKSQGIEGPGNNSNENVETVGTNADTVTQTISAQDGGSIDSSDGQMTLTIPAGALDEDTEISITPVETDNGTVYEFQPDGLVFNEPATATFEVDASEMEDITDEDGNELDTGNIAPSILLFLVDADGSTEVIEDIDVSSEEDSSIVTVSAPIPHFTGLVGTASNGSYAYMTSLGTHYVGSDFKADATVRYLGYSHTSSYQNMSIAYTLRSSTVTQLEFTVSGSAIKHVSPNPITRNAFLSMRGQESATRPKFNCDSVGSSSVEFKATISSVVQVVFQPENKTRVFTVNHTESTTRKGKCIARISSNDYGNSGSDEQYAVATDPTGDVLVDYNNEGTLVPALEVDMDAPAVVDTEMVSLELTGDSELLGTIRVADAVPGSVPNDMAFLSFDFLVLDSGIGDTGFSPFEDALWNLSLDGSGSGSSLTPDVYHWNGDAFESMAGIPLEASSDGQSVNFTVPLSALGMTAEQAEEASYRAVTQVLMNNGDFFADETDLNI